MDQITTALIYKFMDDMDKESVEIGGRASYFVGSFKQYRWFFSWIRGFQGCFEYLLSVLVSQEYGESVNAPLRLESFEVMVLGNEPAENDGATSFGLV